MEKFKNAIILLVIIIGLGSGVFIGSGFSDEDQPSSENTLPPTNLFDQGSSKAFLVVGVNDIHDPLTELESLWLIETDVDSFNIRLHPIYPTAENNSFQSPHDPIFVTPAGPVEVFEIGFIQSNEVDHIIIMDKAAFWTLIQLSDESVETPVDHIQGVQFDNYPHTWEDPVKALDYQVGIISYLCKHSSPFAEAERVEEMVKLINNYLFTDLSLEELLSYWQKLYDNQFVFSCEIK